MFCILYARITDITDRRSTIGPNGLFNSKSVYPQPKSGSVAKDVMGKIQVHVFRSYTILLGVGGACYTEHTLNQFKQLGLDHQRANNLACELHADSVMCANKLVTTRRANENNGTSYSQVLGPGASRNPPAPH
eukprot:1139447-Pelagomonas_calceolata.AAC.1